MACLLLLTISFSVQTTAPGLPLDEIRLIQKDTDTEALKQVIAQILCGQEPLFPVLEIQLQHTTGECTLTSLIQNDSVFHTNHQRHKHHHHHQKIQQKSKFNQYCFTTALKDAAVSWKASLRWNPQDIFIKTWDPTVWFFLPPINKWLNSELILFLLLNQRKSQDPSSLTSQHTQDKLDFATSHNPAGLLNHYTTFSQDHWLWGLQTSHLQNNWTESLLSPFRND